MFKSFIKKWSYIIIPVLVFIFFQISSKSPFNIIDDRIYNKLDTLVSISGSIVSILIAILTIYISLVPVNEKMQKLKQTAHNTILINNIASGIMLYLCNIILWILNLSDFYVVLLFLCASSNLIVTIYYIVKISKHI